MAVIDGFSLQLLPTSKKDLQPKIRNGQARNVKPGRSIPLIPATSATLLPQKKGSREIIPELRAKIYIF